MLSSFVRRPSRTPNGPWIPAADAGRLEGRGGRPPPDGWPPVRPGRYSAGAEGGPIGTFRPRARLEEEVHREAQTFADRRARDVRPGHRLDLTLASAWDLDALLAPLRGRPAGADAVGAAHYAGVVLARAWEAMRLRPRFVVDATTGEIALEASFLPLGGVEGTWRQRYVRDVCSLLEEPPEAVPILPGWSAPGGAHGPLLPRWLLGAALAGHPWAEGERPASGSAADLPRFIEGVLWIQESAVRHHVPDLSAHEESVVRSAVHALAWPPLGRRGNERGETNAAALADAVRDLGAEGFSRLRRVVAILAGSCDADLARAAGAVALAAGFGDDDPVVADALAARGLTPEAYPEGTIETFAAALGGPR